MIEKGAIDIKINNFGSIAMSYTSHNIFTYDYQYLEDNRINIINDTNVNVFIKYYEMNSESFKVSLKTTDLSKEIEFQKDAKVNIINILRQDMKYLEF